MNPTVTIKAGEPQDATMMLQIPRGDVGTDITIEAMRAIAVHGATTREVQDLVREIKPAGAYDADEFINRAFAWFKRNVSFKKDPKGLERVQTPQILLGQIKAGRLAQGDCDCLAPTFAAMLIYYGLGANSSRQVGFVVAHRAGKVEFEHVFICTFSGPLSRNRINRGGHFDDNTTPPGFFALDPQETAAPGQMKSVAARMRVYPIFP